MDPPPHTPTAPTSTFTPPPPPPRSSSSSTPNTRITTRTVTPGPNAVVAVTETSKWPISSPLSASAHSSSSALRGTRPGLVERDVSDPEQPSIPIRGDGSEIGDGMTLGTRVDGVGGRDRPAGSGGAIGGIGQGGGEGAGSHGRSLLQDLYAEAYPLAVQAVQEDISGDHHTARLLYCEVGEVFVKIKQLVTDSQELVAVERKSNQYLKRSEELWEERGTVALKAVKELAPHERLAQEAQFAFEQAVAEVGKHHEQGALDFYTDSADLFLQAWKEAPEGSPFKTELQKKLEEVMSLAEDLKGVPTNSMALLKVRSGSVSSTTVVSGPSNLTPQELQVLRKTMNINNKIYHPWDDSDVRDLLREKGPFIDPDGMLPLSEKQLAKFGSWKRASQIMENPKMIALISSRSIVQDIVTDCSFVASLCVSASYERRFKKQLIRACIYPKNKYGEPCYNPNGKYLVKLMFNGIARRVVVDDFLPVSRTGTLMCTFSTNKNELWPSIVEKAYMRLMGGYDFPGSNSGIDLYALTGWIPEHIFIKEAKFDKDKQWKRIFNGQQNALALVTIATSYLTEEEEEKLGLVQTHAYAVLDLKEIHGLRLLQVKNPWSHKRWKGPFSHLDSTRWTEELKKELNYDQSRALNKDDGIFWIDFESVCINFDTIHINWNPEILTYRAVIHAPWPCDYGPKRDNYTLAYNPQFQIATNVKGTKPSAIWLLLSKHITQTEENRDFITLHVYDGQQHQALALAQQNPQQPQSGSTSTTPTTPTTPGSLSTGAPSSSSAESRSLGSSLSASHSRRPSSSSIAGNSTSSSLSVSTSSLGGGGSAQRAVTKTIKDLVGERIFYDVNTFIKGVYVNSPHILVRFEVPPGLNQYTIVLSQHLKTRDLHFTLRAYGMCEFELREIPKKYLIEKTIESEWTEQTAGGSSYNAEYINNPQYQLVVPPLPAPQTSTSVLMMLETPKDFAIHIKLVNSQGKRVSSVWTRDILVQSGEYRHGFCYCEAKELKSGSYTVVVSTFEPGQQAPFKLTIQSNIDLGLKSIPLEGAGMFRSTLRGEWVLGKSAMGWHHHQSFSYAKNPHFWMPITEMTCFKVRLQTPEISNPTPNINITIFERLEEGILGREVASSGPYTAVPQGVCTDYVTFHPNQYGYLIVVSTLDPGVEGKFVLYTFSDRQLKLEAGGGASSPSPGPMSSPVTPGADGYFANKSLASGAGAADRYRRRFGGSNSSNTAGNTGTGAGGASGAGAG